MSHQPLADTILSPDLPAPTRPDTQALAVVGVGEWARRVIIPTLLRQPVFPGLRQIHLVDSGAAADWVRPDHIEERVRFRHPPSLDAMLLDPRVSAVLICTPEHTHYEVAKQALLADKHVFVEKAFVLDPRQAEELVQLAEGRSLQLMVGYQYMYDARLEAVRDVVASGQLGNLRQLELYLLNHTPVPPSCRTTLVEHHLTHLLSILQLLFGHVEAAQPVMHYADRDQLQMSLDIDGLPAYLATGVGHHEPANFRRLRVSGSRLTLEADFDGQQPSYRLMDSHTLEHIAASDPRYPSALREITTANGVHAELAAFARSIRDGAAAPSGGKAAARLVAVTERMNTLYLQRRANSEAVQRDGTARLQQEQETAYLALEAQDPEIGALFTPHPQKAATAAAQRVARLLMGTPYAPATEVARKCGLSLPQLRVVYKILQRSPGSHSLFRSGANYDYFAVARNFFDRRGFEATFFVGVACPYLCTFCKMNISSMEAPVTLRRFTYRRPDLLDSATIDAALDDLAAMAAEGRTVTVKVSGGLEPMTDVMRVGWILGGARDRGLRTKLYTNGALIDTDEKRALALLADEIRISLNTVNEEKYRRIYLAPSKGNKAHLSLAHLKQVLRKLAAARTASRHPNRIGLNFVVVRETIEDMTTMAEIAEELGLDYVNYNIDYSDEFSADSFLSIRAQITRLQHLAAANHFGRLHLEFGGSLLGLNLFTRRPDGRYDPDAITNCKVFIDPAGVVTPIHEGTYPVAQRDEGRPNPFALGQLGGGSNLREILAAKRGLPPIDFRHLAPFELILLLEQRRLDQDALAGLEPDVSPYRLVLPAED